MAQYKVLQDIEAEDKLLGPLSLRQFIYAVIVIALGFVAFQLGKVQILLVIPFLPPIVFFALLAAPFGREQSSEVWLLAKIKYFIFPRKRVWDQEGTQEMVTVTAPKPIMGPALKDFDKDEARSRLKALAATMDTRGWAVKNLQTQGYVNQYGQQGSSDRLLDLQTGAPEEVAAVKPNEDVLDDNNPLGQTMETMVARSDQVHRQDMLQKLHTLAAQQHEAQARMSRLPASQPVPTPAAASPQQPAQPVVKTTVKPVTEASAPAILKEVKSPASPEELHVAKASKDSGDDADEVVISLH